MDCTTRSKLLIAIISIWNWVMVAIIVINEGLLNSINSNYLLWLWSFCHYNCQSSSQWRHHHSVWTHPFSRFFPSAFLGVCHAVDFIMVRDPVPNVLSTPPPPRHGLLLVSTRVSSSELPNASNHTSNVSLYHPHRIIPNSILQVWISLKCVWARVVPWLYGSSKICFSDSEFSFSWCS